MTEDSTIQDLFLGTLFLELASTCNLNSWTGRCICRGVLWTSESRRGGVNVGRGGISGGIRKTQSGDHPPKVRFQTSEMNRGGPERSFSNDPEVRLVTGTRCRMVHELVPIASRQEWFVVLWCIRIRASMVSILQRRSDKQYQSKSYFHAHIRKNFRQTIKPPADV
ncbi:hypothetical protein VTN31DRAFT_2547 [Thermomyces dupontii]|uniref:uncharacterized protein n=1 Tax=Talaromyces thermophilus TaxID=28565 RepID=UPI003744A02D